MKQHQTTQYKTRTHASEAPVFVLNLLVQLLVLKPAIPLAPAQHNNTQTHSRTRIANAPRAHTEANADEHQKRACKTAKSSDTSTETTARTETEADDEHTVDSAIVHADDGANKGQTMRS